MMITRDTFDFLADLSENNQREWFESNRKRYDKALAQFKTFVQEWHRGLSPFDEDIAANDPNKAVFRIYRDVRFSPNKQPYKDHLGASLAKGGRTSSWAGYYLHIAPGGSFLAGGKWMPENSELKKIRQEIDYNYEQLREIMEQQAFKEIFGSFDTEHSLKTTPRDYTSDHPAIDWLRLKSFVVSAVFTDEEVMANDFTEKVIRYSITMKPLLDFINTALEEV